MHIQADRLGVVVRLYDGKNDNPNELNIVRMHDGRISMGIEDRDGGDNELHIIVTEGELLAALAVLAVPRLSVDAPDQGEYRRPATAGERTATRLGVTDE